MKKYMPVLQCVSSFEGTLYKRLQDIVPMESMESIVTTSYFISCCFTSVFTSADIIFYNFSELDSKLSIKYFFTNFPFLTDSPKPPTPLTAKICFV